MVNGRAGVGLKPRVSRTKKAEINEKKFSSYLADEVRKLRPSGYRGSEPISVKVDPKTNNVQANQIVDDVSTNAAMALAMDKYFARALTLKFKK